MANTLFDKEFKERYLSFDPRSLALFRVCFGITALFEVRRRFGVIEHWYVNDGIMPNHTLLWRPPSDHFYSFFLSLSSYEGAVIGIALCAVVFTFFTLGLFQRVTHPLAFFCMCSLNARIPGLENGGNMVVNTLMLWTMFLPLAERFSIDSLRRSMRARTEHALVQLEDRSALEPNRKRFITAGALAMLAQGFVIYYFNVAHKTGPTWIDGTAVHYTLHQDRLVLPLGVWMRENLPFAVLKGLVYSTIVVECFAVFAIATPFFSRWARLIAFFALPALHFGFAMALDLGPFSWAVMCFFTVLPREEDWEALKRFATARTQRRRVFIDSDCGICTQTARLLARMDRLGRLELVSNQDESLLPEGVSQQLTQNTIVVQNLDTGAVASYGPACAQVLKALPFGFLIAWLASIPPISWIITATYKRVANNRHLISGWLGWGVCGVKTAETPEPTTYVAPAFHASLARCRFRVGQVILALMVFANAGELARVNAAVPQRFKWKEPTWSRMLVEYPRLLQGWRMFAPDAPLEDEYFYVDAVTQDGRHVDPYNEVASNDPAPFSDTVPTLLGQDQYFTSYTLFFPQRHFGAYRTAFREWIERYQDRTGNPNDRIVYFEAWEIWDSSPPPGQTQPTPKSKKKFMVWGKRPRDFVPATEADAVLRDSR